MAKAPRLKVFRTAIGFHDAYVAAASRKAALEAWGTTKDLFARGAAELVEDPVLAEEPLAHPGEVIKRSRGTTAEQIAALPKSRKSAKKPAEPPAPAKPRPKRPRPSRTALEQAERHVEDVKARQIAEDHELDREEQALARKRAALERKHRDELAKAETAARDARDKYEEALSAWEP